MTQTTDAPERADGPKRTFVFDHACTINGETSVACVEPIAQKLRACPEATTRIVVRWEGRLKAGAAIDVDGDAYTVHRMFPLGEGVRVAHLLCSRAA